MASLDSNLSFKSWKEKAFSKRTEGITLEKIPEIIELLKAGLENSINSKDLKRIIDLIKKMAEDSNKRGKSKSLTFADKNSNCFAIIYCIMAPDKTITVSYSIHIITFDLGGKKKLRTKLGDLETYQRNTAEKRLAELDFRPADYSKFIVEQVQDEKYKNLGKHPILSSHTTNPIKNVEVKLRRNGRQEVVKVCDAFSEFADQNFDLDKLVKSPESFSYNKLGPNSIQGFPYEKREGLDNWYTEAGGNASEEKVFNQLCETLKAPGLIMNGLQQRDLLKVLKQNIQEDVSTLIKNSKHLLGLQITPDEWGLAAMLNIERENIESKANELFLALCDKVPDPVPKFSFIEENYLKQNNVNMKKYRGLFLNLKEEFVKQHVLYNRQPFLIEVQHFITRFSYKKEIDRNYEFDFICTKKSEKALIHLEIKSYPQKGVINPKGLKKVFLDSCQVIEKGKEFIENIVGPFAELTTDWTRVSLVWFPEIPNKKPFQDLNLKKKYLKYILTAEDLGSDKWWTTLGLGVGGIDDGGYKRLFSFLMGSTHVSVDSQIYDWSKDRRDVNERLVGATGIGIGGETFPKFELQSKHLKGIHLGHVHNMIFWSPDQKKYKERKGHNALVGDYGGGKSSIMISIALREAEDPNNIVVYISAASVDPMTGKTTILYPIFDEALKLKFEGTNVKVFSVHSLNHRYDLPQNTGLLGCLRAFFTEFGGENLVVLLDETSISHNDLRQIAKQKESDLSETCQLVSDNCKTSWISLSSSALLELSSSYTLFDIFSAPLSKVLNTFVGVEKVDLSNLEEYFEKHTKHRIATLMHTMRNTTNIVKTAEDVSKYGHGMKMLQQTRNVIASGASHTIPGEKPDLVFSKTLETSIKFILEDLLHLASRRQRKLFIAPICERLVVLCDGSWPPREVARAVKGVTGWGGDIRCYDSGVKWTTGWVSKGWEKDSRSAVTLQDQRQELSSFLRSSSGILLTYGQLFSGMENAIVVYMTRDLGGNIGGGGVRSNILRACSKLVVVSEKKWSNLDQISSMFNIHDLY